MRTPRASSRHTATTRQPGASTSMRSPQPRRRVSESSFAPKRSGAPHPPVGRRPTPHPTHRKPRRGVGCRPVPARRDRSSRATSRRERRRRQHQHQPRCRRPRRQRQRLGNRRSLPHPITARPTPQLDRRTRRMPPGAVPRRPRWIAPKFVAARGPRRHSRPLLTGSPLPTVAPTTRPRRAPQSTQAPHHPRR